LRSSRVSTLLDLTKARGVHVSRVVLDGSAATATPRSNVEAFVVLQDAAENTFDVRVGQYASTS
jgi:hypothetical protein